MMWALILIIITAQGIGVTHLDNFESKQRCNEAAIAVGKYSHWSEKMQISCVKEVDQ